MKRILILVVLSAMLLTGIAQAATSQLDNMPGGAGVVYYQAGGAGTAWQSLINWQNISPAFNIAVHIIVYTKDSVEACDFKMPLTALDNVGLVFTNTGGKLMINSYSDDAFGGSVIHGMNYQCKGAVAVDGLFYGYATYVVDIAVPVIPLVNPMTFASATKTNYVLPDFLFVRNALMHGTAEAVGVNGASLQGFANMMAPGSINGGLSEGTFAAGLGLSQFENTTGTDHVCTAAQNWNHDASVNTFATVDSNSGPAIDSWELYLTDNINTAGANDGLVFIPRLLADGAISGGANCNTTPSAMATVVPQQQFTGVKKALGSANGTYFARYNQQAGFVDSTLIMIFPANNPEYSPFAYRSGVILDSLNDAEQSQSAGVGADEVARISYATDINLTGTAGETIITTDAPMFGWIYTEGAAGFADMYPIFRQRAWIDVTNLNGVDQVAGGTVTDAVWAGL